MILRIVAMLVAIPVWISNANADSTILASVDLRDGSRLIGRITSQEYAFVRDDGRKLRFSTRQTVRIEADDDRELSTLQLAEGSVRGVVEWKQFEISGLFGRVKVPFDQVKRVEFVQPKLGLVAHFRFDGDCQDSSGNNNHGQPHDDVNFSTGKIGKAASFDGEGDYISVMPKSDVSKIGDFTLSAWVFVEKWKKLQAGIRNDLQYVFDGFSDPKRRINHTDGFGLVCYNATKNEEILCYLIVNEKNFRRHRLPVQLVGQWRLLTFTRNQNREFSYIDGKLVSDRAEHSPGTIKPLLNMKRAWHIGTFGANDPNFKGIKSGRRYGFLGRIDDLRIYDRALSPYEVRLLAMGGSEK